MTNGEIEALFFEERREADYRIRSGGRVVHYTSADAAARIISGRQVWLRNALLMNDFSEIQHGLECLYAGWRSEAGERFKQWLDRVLPNFQEELEKAFDEETFGLRVATFMMSLSEHDALFDRLIIGPTARPLPVYHSLHNLLMGAGIEDPSQRISVSYIPLRE